MTSIPIGKLDRTAAMMDNCITGNLLLNEIDAKFAEKLFHPVFPVLSKFPFMRIHPCVDIY